MSIGFPTNTVIMIIASMMSIGIGAWYLLSYGIQRLSTTLRFSQAWRWGTALVLAVWLLARLALAFAAPNGGRISVPVLVTFITLGMLAGVLPLLFSPAFRQIVRAIPETWLIGLHALRILEWLFLALADMRLLPTQFAIPAGYGDITTGLLALGVVYLLAEQKPYARAAAVAWNLFGLLDLVTAQSTGIRFIGPFAAQVAASGISLAYLNFVFIIPTFGVPVYMLLHIYSLYQILSPAASLQQKGSKQIRTEQPGVQPTPFRQ